MYIYQGLPHRVGPALKECHASTQAKPAKARSPQPIHEVSQNIAKSYSLGAGGNMGIMAKKTESTIMVLYRVFIGFISGCIGVI